MSGAKSNKGTRRVFLSASCARLPLRIVFLFAVFILLASPQLRAQSTVGDVSFANSGAPAVQKDFLRGLAQLHNFEYDDAAAAFRRAEEADPDFAMAYWGEAMTSNHPIWEEQNRRAARNALQKLAPTPEERLAKAKTGREKDYLRSVEILYGEGEKYDRDARYADFLRGMHEKYPADIDATCFYALALLGTAHNGRDVPTYMHAAALLEDVFYAHPGHPAAAHYLIHSFDDPTHAILGLRAARAYSKIAPEAAHAQHMTSHIFLALGMWDDVVSANETATGIVNRQRAAMTRPEQSCGHYNLWLEYGYLQQGRFADARRILTACRGQAEAQSAAGHNHGAVDPDSSAAGSFVQMRAHYLIETREWSGEAARWKLPSGSSAWTQLMFEYTDAHGDFHRGDGAAARDLLAQLQSLAPQLNSELDGERYSADNWMRKVPGILTAQIQALVLSRDGALDKAAAAFQTAADEEASLPSAFGPPLIAKPSHELLGEFLLERSRNQEARKAFETALSRAPQRVQALIGLQQAQTLLKDPAAAQTDATLHQIYGHADHPLKYSDTAAQ
jgi:tetratricopeptide (TPR) repeat protein